MCVLHKCKNITLGAICFFLIGLIFGTAYAKENVAVSDNGFFSQNGLYYHRMTGGKVEVVGISNKKVTSVTIPTSIIYQKRTYQVSQIGKKAFADCTALKTVAFGGYVSEIKKNAFRNCGNLKKITVYSQKMWEGGTEQQTICFPESDSHREYYVEDTSLAKLKKKGSRQYKMQLCKLGSTEIMVLDRQGVHKISLQIKHKHAYEQKSVFLPNEKRNGYKIFGCGCGDTKKTILQKCTGEGVWTVVKEPTTRENGREELRCSDCGRVISTQTIPSTGKSVLSLKGKTIIGIGDSLMRGNEIGYKYTWLNLLGRQHGMNVYNYSANGVAISASQNSPFVSLSDRYIKVIREVPKADYIILLGGANDFKYDVPIGVNSDKTNETFKGALNNMLDGLSEAYPNARILCMTNYRRYNRKNNLGIHEKEYVQAMKEVCGKRQIPCFDNYQLENFDLSTAKNVKWCDEGIYLGKKRNRHFNPQGYRGLMPIYRSFLLNNI